MNIENIKNLRKITQASYAECKKALKEANQDIKEAENILMKRGLRIINSAPTNESEIGIVHSYIHPGNRIGVLVELHCDTDFVAKTEEFQRFAREIALQIASMKPKYISRDDVPEEDYLKEYDRRSNNSNPEAELVQWFSEVCLLEQTYIKDNSKIIKELLAELINKVNESCRIKRFIRWEIGN